jgi:hypothetical protein
METARIGRDVGAGYDARYRGFDLKTEYEIGLSPTEQLSFDFNNRYLDSSVREGLRFDGFQISYMRMLAHPDKNTWGQAIYLEPGYSQTSSKTGGLRDEYSLEVKYLLQHNFGANQEGVYAANLVAEIESKPATDEDAETQFAFVVLNQIQAHIVPANRRAVVRRAGDCDLELAGQKRKLRVQRAPLPQNFGKPVARHGTHRP